MNSENTLAQFALIRRNRRSSSGFSRNLRKEVSKQDKIYFWDLGVHNAAIDNLKPLTERNDVGALWENFVLAERLKWLHYHQTLASLYLRRTYTGAEIDIVEEREGGLYAYECKTPLPNTLNLCPLIRLQDHTTRCEGGHAIRFLRRPIAIVRKPCRPALPYSMEDSSTTSR